jgi:nucleoside-diphosphate-sugar epimerase
MLKDKKILLTGATGQIAGPIAENLAKDNEVWCAARFSDPVRKAELEAMGIISCPWELGTGDFSNVPTDFSHVLHAAALFITEEHDEVVRINAEGTALLMQHCKSAEAFVFVSSFCLYRRHDDPKYAYAETDNLGGYATYGASYPVSKIATEGAVRAAAQMLGLPTTIARMNIGYSHTGHGGLPVMYQKMMKAGQPIAVPKGYDNWGSPISGEDIALQAHAMFDIASVPATIVNWAGDDAVSDREMCDYIGSITGVTPIYEESDVSYDSFISDNTRREALIGKCSLNWKDGIRRLFEQLGEA